MQRSYSFLLGIIPVVLDDARLGAPVDMHFFISKGTIVCLFAAASFPWLAFEVGDFGLPSL